MTLHMIELTVADVRVTAAWYGAVAGATVELDDEARGFLLLAISGTPVKLALKQGDAEASGTLLHFQVQDLSAAVQRLTALGIHPTDAGKVNDEGYRRARYADPNGRGIVLFEWVERQSKASGGA